MAGGAWRDTLAPQCFVWPGLATPGRGVPPKRQMGGGTPPPHRPDIPPATDSYSRHPQTSPDTDRRAAGAPHPRPRPGGAGMRALAGNALPGASVVPAAPVFCPNGRTPAAALNLATSPPRGRSAFSLCQGNRSRAEGDKVYRPESCRGPSHPLWNRSLATPTHSSDREIVREEAASYRAIASAGGCLGRCVRRAEDRDTDSTRCGEPTRW
jgi:hypothetical protein